MSSEVAQLRQQLQDEYQAGKNGLSGLASGTARHDFITQRLENLGKIQTELEALVGSEKAMEIMNETIAAL